MNFSEMIKNMKEAYGFEELHADETKTITFNFEDVYVAIKEEDEHFFFVSSLCTLGDNRLNLYKMALKENNFGQLNGYIGAIEESKALVFTTKIHTKTLSVDYLLEALNKHISHTEDLIKKVEQIFIEDKHSVAPHVNNQDMIDDISKLMMSNALKI